MLESIQCRPNRTPNLFLEALRFPCSSRSEYPTISRHPIHQPECPDQSPSWALALAQPWPWRQVQAHQQLFFALESLNLNESMNEKVFVAIHTDRNKLDTPEAMADLLAKNGVDRKQFLDAYGSFGVKARVQRATQLAAAYKIDGVPTFGIGGKFITSPSMAGSNGNSLKILDTLIDRVRKGA